MYACTFVLGNIFQYKYNKIENIANRFGGDPRIRLAGRLADEQAISSAYTAFMPCHGSNMLGSVIHENQ